MRSIRSHPWRAAGAALAAVVVIAIAGGAVWLSGLGHPRHGGGPAELQQTLDPRKADHPGDLRVAYIGASVTRGWYVTSIEDAYPAVSARMLATARQRDVAWRVVALPGAPVATVLTWPIPADQDIVVIHVVSDDFLYGTPLDVYGTRYRSLLDKVRAASPKADIVCLGDWGKVGAVNRLGMFAYDYNGDFDTPGSRGPVGHPSLFGPAHGDFHPNDLGDRLIAESVVDGIEGRPPVEQVPPGATVVAPAPVIPDPGPGSHPPPVHGREPHRS
jgi:hypothetical protein